MKRWSKGYEALRSYVRFAFWLTHKKIVVVGKEEIPKDQPIIFAANHQNALMDPLALSCTNPLQTLWLARADIFKSRLAKPALNFMKMIPIYRIRDGKDNLSNNEEIFRQVTQVLENKDSVALFPEAAHSGKRQMLPHKKAIPRIALEAEAKNDFQLNLQIVPVGIYYDHYWNFNRTLIVQYGNAIGVDRYKVSYSQNAQNSMLLLRDEIHDILEPLTLQINSNEYYNDYENIRALAGKEYLGKNISAEDIDFQLFKSDQKLMDQIALLESGHPEIFQDLVSKSRDFQKELNKTNFSAKQVEKAKQSTWLGLIFKAIGVILSSTLLVFGLLLNIVPYLIPRYYLTRKVKDPAFRSTFIFVAGLLLFPLFYLLETSLIWLFSGSAWLAIASFLAMPFAGKWAFQLLVFDAELVQLIRLRTIRFRTAERLWNQRLAIMKIIGRLK